MPADPVLSLFEDTARRVPAWMYVQDQGYGVVSFVGASRVTEPQHPLRHGSKRTHQFLSGELIVRPQFMVATDAMTGCGLAHLVTSPHSIPAMLAKGEYLFDHRG